MKIGFIVQQFPKVSETFILNQVRALSKMGHDVTVLSIARPKVGEGGYDEGYKVIYADMPRRRSEQLFSLPRILLAPRPRGMGTKLRFINPFIFGKGALSLRRLYLLSAVGLLMDAEVLICHFGDVGQLGSDLKRMGYRGKVVTFFHGYDVAATFKHADLYLALFREGDLFLPISQFWKQRLIEIGCSPDKVKVHHMGIDTNAFEFKARSAPEGRARIISVGRLVEKKGHEYSIRAVRRLVDANIDVEYAIVGGGPLTERLSELIIELGLEDRVILAGEVTHQDLLKMYEGAHIFMLPSVTASSGDMEGIPMVLMEAMAMGMPVISTYHSGIPELVEDEVSGYLVPERDIDRLTDATIRLLDHSDRWPDMGRAGRAKVISEFNLDACNRELVARMSQLLDE